MMHGVEFGKNMLNDEKSSKSVTGLTPTGHFKTSFLVFQPDHCLGVMRPRGNILLKVTDDKFSNFKSSQWLALSPDSISRGLPFLRKKLLP